jgi:hypothetical protein
MRGREIYRNEPWYLAEPAPEGEWRGRLERSAAPLGPGERGGLGFRLVADGLSLPVYSAGVEHLLAPFVDRRVLVRGKRVRPGERGEFGEELWPAWLEPLDREEL